MPRCRKSSPSSSVSAPSMGPRNFGLSEMPCNKMTQTAPLVNPRSFFNRGILPGWYLIRHLPEDCCMDAPLDRWTQTLAQTGLSKFLNHFAERFPDEHLKDLDFDSIG